MLVCAEAPRLLPRGASAGRLPCTAILERWITSFPAPIQGNNQQVELESKQRARHSGLSTTKLFVRLSHRLRLTPGGRCPRRFSSSSGPAVSRRLNEMNFDLPLAVGQGNCRAAGPGRVFPGITPAWRRGLRRSTRRAWSASRRLTSPDRSWILIFNRPDPSGQERCGGRLEEQLASGRGARRPANPFGLGPQH